MTEDTGVIEEQLAAAPEAEAQAEAQQVSDKELNFTRLREAAEAAKAEADYWRMNAMQQQQNQQKPNVDQFDLNKFADDDVPTYGELKRMKAQENQERAQHLQKLKELEMRSQYNDYAEVVKTYLPDVLQEDPDLAIAIKDNPMMQKLAYKLAQTSPKYHEQRLAKQNSAVMNKIAENTSRPAPSNARKNAVVGYSEESQMSGMSDDQIMATFNMAKARS